MDDKDKSVIDKFLDTLSEKVEEVAKSAVMPTVYPEEEAMAEKMN